MLATPNGRTAASKVSRRAARPVRHRLSQMSSVAPTPTAPLSLSAVAAEFARAEAAAGAGLSLGARTYQDFVKLPTMESVQRVTSPLLLWRPTLSLN